MQENLNEKAREVFEESTSKVTEEDVAKAIENEGTILDKVLNNKPLLKFLDDIKVLFSIIKDYFKGEYRVIPFWIIAAIVVALLYVLNPIDLIPDYIPVLGYVDDAAVVALCLKMIGNDLEKYKVWKANRELQSSTSPAAK